MKSSYKEQMEIFAKTFKVSVNPFYNYMLRKIYGFAALTALRQANKYKEQQLVYFIRVYRARQGAFYD